MKTIHTSVTRALALAASLGYCSAWRCRRPPKPKRAEPLQRQKLVSDVPGEAANNRFGPRQRLGYLARLDVAMVGIERRH